MTVMAAALVYGLVAWINSTGMITPAWPDNPLQLNVADRVGMAHDVQRCYALAETRVPSFEQAYKVALGLDGLYCGDRVTIDGEDVDLNTPQGQTVLVHELVHWLQEYNGDAGAAPCIPALERDAYEVHLQWQATMGLTMSPDRATIAMRSMCDQPGE